MIKIPRIKISIRVRGVSAKPAGKVLQSIFIFVLLGFPNALAIEPSSELPPQVNPGLVSPLPNNANAVDTEKPIEPEVITLPDLQNQAKNKPRETLTPDSISEASEDKPFWVETIELKGCTAFSERAMSNLIKSYEHQQLNLAALTELVEVIQIKYRKHGYFTAFVYLPPQDVSEGKVTIQVLEGKLGDVSIQGSRFYKPWLITRYLSHNPNDLLNIPQLENNLRRMNQSGDFRVSATLSPNTQAGTTDLRLNVEERLPWQMAFTFDNQGRPTIGTMRWGSEFRHRNLLGMQDRLNLRWIGAAGTQALFAGYDLPLNRFGTEIGTSFGFTRVDVDLPKVRDNYQIIGHAYSYGLSLAQPLDSKQVWRLDTGLQFRHVLSFFNGELDSQSQSEIRTWQLGLNFNKPDRFGNTFIRTQTSLGSTWFGGNSSFWKMESLLNRIIFLPKDNCLILRSHGQFTPGPLPPAEQFQLGGAYSVRGYTEGLMIGDRGYQFSVEHRWPIPGLARMRPAWARKVQGAFFVDYGRVWIDAANPRFNPSQLQYTALASTGVGVRTQLSNAMQGFVDFGFGLLNRSNLEVNAQPTARIHFGIRSDWINDQLKARSQNVTFLFPSQKSKKAKTPKKKMAGR